MGYLRCDECDIEVATADTDYVLDEIYYTDLTPHESRVIGDDEFILCENCCNRLDIKRG